MFNLEDQKAKRREWLRRLRLMEAIEKPMEERLLVILKNTYENAARALEAGIEELGVFVDRNTPRVAAVFKEGYRRAAVQFGEGTLLEIEASEKAIRVPESKGQSEEFWTYFRNFEHQYMGQKIVGMNNVTRGLIANHVAGGLRDGKPHKKVAKELREHGLVMNTVRARRIARTEVHGASNFATDAAVRSAKVEMVREWMATLDARVRKAHIAANGQRRDMDRKFDVGPDELRYPGDPAGSPANVINCRCILLYHKKKAEKSTPPPPPPPPKPKPKPKPKPPKKPRKPDDITPPDTMPSTDPEFMTPAQIADRFERTVIDPKTDPRWITMNEEHKELMRQANAAFTVDGQLYSEYMEAVRKHGRTSDAAVQIGDQWRERVKRSTGLADKAKKKLKEMNELLEDLTDGNVYKLLDMVNPKGDTMKIVPQFLGSGATNPVKKKILKSLAKFERMGVPVKHSAVGTDVNMTVKVGTSKYGRANYKGLSRQLNLSRYNRRGTWEHEAGHWLEHGNPVVHKMSVEFRRMRTEGDTLEKLSKLTGNRGYKASEKAKKDKFIDAYMGKFYPFKYSSGGVENATEIISMGMEYMLSNPMSLLKKDREMFEWMIEVMRVRTTEL